MVGALLHAEPIRGAARVPRPSVRRNAARPTISCQSGSRPAEGGLAQVLANLAHLLTPAAGTPDAYARCHGPVDVRACRGRRLSSMPSCPGLFVLVSRLWMRVVPQLRRPLGGHGPRCGAPGGGAGPECPAAPG